MGHHRTLSIILLCAVIAASVPVLTGAVFGADDAQDTAEEGPQAEAGLDQTVRQGAVVVLNAGGSLARDGRIVAYNWTIRRPDNTTTTPECPNCRQTTFQPSRPGTYAVTVAVTDNSNQTATDTMYVEVRAHDPPEATIVGPDEIVSNGTATVQFRADSGDAPLESVALYRDGELLLGEALTGGPFRENLTISYPDPGPAGFALVAADEAGHASTAVHNLTVGAVPSNFAVEILDTSERGDDLEVAVEVTNVGGRNDTQQIRVCRDRCDSGAVIDNLGTVTLARGENVTMTGVWPSWADETGEIVIAAESEDDRDTVRKIEAEPSHITIEGLPGEMEGGGETTVKTLLHYESGVTEDVTANATYSLSQTESHAYVTIPEQDEYSPLGVRAVSTEVDPDTNGEGIIGAEYEEMTTEARTEILPECEINPRRGTCQNTPNYKGSGQPEWLWRLQGALVPDTIDVSETVNPGTTIFHDGGQDPVRMDVLIYDYVKLDGFYSSEADPKANYTSWDDTKADYRIKTPETDTALWVWEPDGRFASPYRADKRYTGRWGAKWDRWSSMTGAEGSAFVHMDQGVISKIDPREPGQVDICLDFIPNVFEPRNDHARFACQSMEIVDEEDDGGDGNPYS
jgi:hypothetical protein